MPALFQGWIPSIAVILVFFITIILLKAAFQAIVTMSGTMAYVSIGSRLRISTFYALLQRKNPQFISAAEINFRITEIAQKAGSFCNFGVSLLTTVVQSLTLMLIMLWIVWEVTIFGIAMLSIIGFSLSLYNYLWKY